MCVCGKAGGVWVCMHACVRMWERGLGEGVSGFEDPSRIFKIKSLTFWHAGKVPRVKYLTIFQQKNWLSLQVVYEGLKHIPEAPSN